MAIDTNNKKFALITYQQMWAPPMPISADAIGQDDKQHLLAQYPGILWAAVEVWIDTAIESLTTARAISSTTIMRAINSTTIMRTIASTTIKRAISSLTISRDITEK